MTEGKEENKQKQKQESTQTVTHHSGFTVGHDEASLKTHVVVNFVKTKQKNIERKKRKGEV